MSDSEELKPQDPLSLEPREILLLFWLTLRSLLPRLVVLAGAALLVTLFVMFWLR